MSNSKTNSRATELSEHENKMREYKRELKSLRAKLDVLLEYATLEEASAKLALTLVNKALREMVRVFAGLVVVDYKNASVRLADEVEPTEQEEENDD